MSDWWQGLAPRERVLIAVAGGLTALIMLWQFAFVPVSQGREAARASHDAARATLSRVQDAYIRQRALGTVQAAAQPGLSGDDLKIALTQSARDKGVAIARLQGGGGEAIGLVVDRVDPRLAFAWLDEIETRLGGRITRLTIEPSGGDLVRLSVDIVEGS